jgi:hypothetical protein
VVELKQKLRILRDIAMVPELLLSLGGDDRLTIDFEKTRVNKYLSSTIPNDKVIRRGSCTCSTVVSDTTDFVQELQTSALSNIANTNTAAEALQHYRLQCDDVIEQLSSFVCDMNKPASEREQLVLFPSGSDAEFLPLIIALIRSFNLSNHNSDLVKVYNFVIAAGEVGSGTPQAANGQHFSDLAPTGKEQKTGAFLLGLQEKWVTMIQYKPRNQDGMIDFQETKLIADVTAKLNAETTSVAVVHLVHLVFFLFPLFFCIFLTF